MLDQMTDAELIQYITDDEDASALELNLVERLQCARAELNRLTSPMETS